VVTWETVGAPSVFTKVSNARSAVGFDVVICSTRLAVLRDVVSGLTARTMRAQFVPKFTLSAARVGGVFATAGVTNSRGAVLPFEVTVTPTGTFDSAVAHTVAITCNSFIPFVDCVRRACLSTIFAKI